MRDQAVKTGSGRAPIPTQEKVIRAEEAGSTLVSLHAALPVRGRSSTRARAKGGVFRRVIFLPVELSDEGDTLSLYGKRNILALKILAEFRSFFNKEGMYEKGILKRKSVWGWYVLALGRQLQLTGHTHEHRPVEFIIPVAPGEGCMAGSLRRSSEVQALADTFHCG